MRRTAGPTALIQVLFNVPGLIVVHGHLDIQGFAVDRFNCVKIQCLLSYREVESNLIIVAFGHGNDFTGIRVIAQTDSIEVVFIGIPVLNLGSILTKLASRQCNAVIV